jgi:environmental stress-induced protein Ves
MMQHLTLADYRQMPWANGQGVTTEIMRVDGPDGAMRWRFSMAAVVENGPFSRFEGIERNLTVIEGPGFDLIGATTLRADPLRPVAFAGDTQIRAANVTGKAIDFNVMTDRRLPKPLVQVIGPGEPLANKGGLLCLFALTPAQYGGQTLEKHDILIGTSGDTLIGGPAIAVTLFLNTV